VSDLQAVEALAYYAGESPARIGFLLSVNGARWTRVLASEIQEKSKLTRCREPLGRTAFVIFIRSVTCSGSLRVPTTCESSGIPTSQGSRSSARCASRIHSVGGVIGTV
jgi:hypothetical protein